MNRLVASAIALVAVTACQATITFADTKDKLDPHSKFDLTYAGRPGTNYPGSLWMVLHGDSGPAAVSGTLTAQGAFERQDQGNTWQGNFANGEALVWTARHASSFTFHTSKPMAGMGAYVSAANSGAYRAMIEALSSTDQVLASFTADGFNNTLGNSDAAYLGVVSDSRNIAGIRLSLVGGGDLAISSIDVRPNPVPEPQLWAMGGLASALWLRRRMGS